MADTTSMSMFFSLNSLKASLSLSGGNFWAERLGKLCVQDRIIAGHVGVVEPHQRGFHQGFEWPSRRHLVLRDRGSRDQQRNEKSGKPGHGRTSGILLDRTIPRGGGKAKPSADSVPRRTTAPIGLLRHHSQSRKSVANPRKASKPTDIRHRGQEYGRRYRGVDAETLKADRDQRPRQRRRPARLHTMAAAITAPSRQSPYQAITAAAMRQANTMPLRPPTVLPWR